MPDPVNPSQGTSLIRPMFRTLGIAASGLSAQRMRMEIIATNIANAETTHTAAGGPYRRRMVQMESATADGFQQTLQAAAPSADAQSAPSSAGAAAAPSPPAALGDDATLGQEPGLGVTVTAITEDNRQGPLVYDPAHPDADANGYVRYPNVRITDELVDMMDAKRMYEANATVFNAVKQMLRRAIEI